MAEASATPAAELRGVSRAGAGERPGKETNTIWEAAYTGDIRTLRAFIRNGCSVNRENPVGTPCFSLRSDLPWIALGLLDSILRYSMWKKAWKKGTARRRVLLDVSMEPSDFFFFFFYFYYFYCPLHSPSLSGIVCSTSSIPCISR